MSLPRKNKHWTKEVTDAINASVQIAQAESGSLTVEVKQNIYKYAAMFAAKNRKVVVKDEIAGMARYAAKQRVRDFTVKPEIISNYEINFMLSYMDAHVYLDLISASKHSEIMRAMIDNYEFILDLE